jgi:hypothetical protein
MVFKNIGEIGVHQEREANLAHPIVELSVGVINRHARFFLVYGRFFNLDTARKDDTRLAKDGSPKAFGRLIWKEFVHIALDTTAARWPRFDRAHGLVEGGVVGASAHNYGHGDGVAEHHSLLARVETG